MKTIDSQPQHTQPEHHRSVSAKTIVASALMATTALISVESGLATDLADKVNHERVHIFDNVDFSNIVGGVR